MNHLRPLPATRVLDDSFFTCVQADQKRAIVTPVIEQTMTETLADIMPKKPKGKARKARMPLDGS